MEDASKLGNEYAKIHEQNLNAVDLLTTACRTVTNMYKDMGDLSQQVRKVFFPLIHFSSSFVLNKTWRQ